MQGMLSTARQCKGRFIATGVLIAVLTACGGGGGGGGFPVFPGSDGTGVAPPPPPPPPPPAPPPGQAGSYSVQANYTQGTVLEYATDGDAGPGLLRIELGAPKTIAGKVLHALEATQWNQKAGTGPYTPKWKYLGSADGAIVGSRDGQAVETIYGVDGQPVGGMFEGFDAKAPTLRTGSVDGVYDKLTAVIAAADVSEGGCHTVAGQQTCDDFSASVSTAEYFKNGIGPIGSRYSSRYISSGGGIGSAGSTTRNIELVRTTLVPADGEALPDFRSGSVANLAPAYGNSALAAHDGKIYAFAADNAAVRVSVYDPATDTWADQSSVARSATPAGLAPNSSWKAYSFGADLVALVLGRDIFWYQPSTHQWTRSATIPRSPDDQDTVQTGENDSPDSAVWTDAGGQMHLLVAGFAKRYNNGLITRIATIYDSRTNGAIGTIQVGVTPAARMVVIGNRIYLKKEAHGIVRCTLPALNDCADLGSVLQQGVLRSKWIAAGTKILEVGGDSATSGGNSPVSLQRGIQAFDTATGEKSVVLPPTISSAGGGSGRQIVALDGKLYLSSGAPDQLGVETYTP